MDQFENCLKSLVELSPKTRVFVLIHKMDLVPEDQRSTVFEERRNDVMQKIDGRFNVDCFSTSIWDETLYKAWS